MDAERYQRIKAIFAEVVELDPGRQDELLSRACGSDLELRRGVEALLVGTEHFFTGDLQLAVQPTAFQAPEQAGLGELPRRFGPYELEREVGRGGMGIVYAARDTRLERHVALKLITVPGISGERARSMLQREARTLAALTHPHVATIHSLEDIEDRIRVAGNTGVGRRGPDTDQRRRVDMPGRIAVIELAL